LFSDWKNLHGWRIQKKTAHRSNRGGMVKLIGLAAAVFLTGASFDL